MKSWEQFYIEFLVKIAKPIDELPNGIWVYNTVFIEDKI